MNRPFNCELSTGNCPLLLHIPPLKDNYGQKKDQRDVKRCVKKGKADFALRDRQMMNHPGLEIQVFEVWQDIIKEIADFLQKEIVGVISQGLEFPAAVTDDKNPQSKQAA